MRKWHRHRLLCALLALPALAASPAIAKPVRVDRSFGRKGVARTRLEPSYRSTAFTALTAEPDGAVLAVRDGTVWRYLANGRLDPGFQPHAAAAPPATSKLTVVQPDGKTVVAEAVLVGPASKTGSFQEIVVSRFNADGSPDAGFGNGGAARLRAEYGVPESRPQGLLTQDDGGVVAIGSYSAVKLDAAGKLDAGYGEGGIVNSVGPIVGFQRLAGDGLLLAGWYIDGQQGDLFVARYGADGRPDPAFGGGDGLATADSGGQDFARAALWEADGSIAIGGVTTAVPGGCTSWGYCDSAPAVARFTADGRLDAGFGTAGIVTLGALPGKVDTGAFGEVGVLALAERPGGGVLAAGTSGPADSVAFVAALGSAGGLDPGFGEGGIVRERRPKPSFQEIGAIAVAPDRKILVAGTTDADTEFGTVLFRYRPNGRLDRSFAGGAGFARLLVGRKVVALAVDRRGRAVLLSGAANLTRVGAGGVVDRSFGDDGHTGASGHLELKSVATLPQGGILAAGQIGLKGVARMVVFRFGPRGALVPSFGHRGRVVLGARRRCPCDLRRLAVQPDGRIVVAGSARGALVVARLQPDGALDRGFGRRGRVAVRLGKPSEGTAVAVQGGRILVAGWSGKEKRTDNVLLRLTPRGRLDRSFGRRGIARVHVPKSTEPSAVLPTRHRVFVVRKGGGRSILAYRPNGQLDRSFAGRRNAAPRRFGGMVGALQRGDPVLAWTTRERAGRPRTIALQRLAAR
jgi:uncharacterized delta-60 repeat protein